VAGSILAALICAFIGAGIYLRKRKISKGNDFETTT